jgi:NAD-dependent SIR2 family protein deacetylase
VCSTVQNPIAPFLKGGKSCTPASFIPVISKQSGAKVIEINSGKTPLTQDISDYLIMGKAGPVMKQIMEKLEPLL